MIGFNFILCSSILAGSVLSNRPHCKSKISWRFLNSIIFLFTFFSPSDFFLAHLTHVEMKVDLQARNSALDAAAFLESAVTYIECQLAQGLTQAALALGINKGSTTTCIAPGSSSSVTPILAVPAAIKPAAQVPAAVAAIVGVTVPTSVPIVNAAIVIAGNVDSIIAAVPVSTTPIPAVMPNPVTSSSVSVSISTTSTSSATASVSTGDPCISTNPDVCLQQTLALTAHNLARAKHHAPPLLWSNALAASALEWAENCQWVHSGGSLYPPSYVYGENLYASTLDEPQTSMTIG